MLVSIRNFQILITSGLMMVALTINAQAATITCGDKYRSASVSSANACYAQTLGSTLKADDVKAITGNTWSLVNGLAKNGVDGWLTVSATGWGDASASGAWSIKDLFWDNFTSALITMHVGGGQKDAVDNFEWLITPETLAGTFSYVKTAGKGGGLSNIKLWGMGTVLKPEPTPIPPPQIEPKPVTPPVPDTPPKAVKVPEPAALALLALGLLGLVIIRRKRQPIE